MYFISSISTMNPFMKLTKADFTLIDPQLRTGKGVKFNDVAGLRVSCHVFVIPLIFPLFSYNGTTSLIRLYAKVL